MVVTYQWELTYNTYLAIHTSCNIGLVIFHHNYNVHIILCNVINIIGQV